MQMHRIALAVMLLMGSVSLAGDIAPAGTHCLQVPVDLRLAYLNLDGSCVLDSLGIGGIHANDPKAAYLPFPSPYGPPERGGADPERIAHICNARGIKAWNVTGQPTIDMARWAVATNRACAIGFDYQHFQTVWGYDSKRKIWLICDNRCPEKISEYSEARFEEMHNRVRWVVVLDRPMPRIPCYQDW